MFRAERLNAHWFMSLDDARRKCEAWRRDYNEERPHSAIGNKERPTELKRDYLAIVLVVGFVAVGIVISLSAPAPRFSTTVVTWSS
jgi:Integrase core domain